MAMKLSGLMSGMDTDSIIQELVAARRTKVDKQTKAQTKLSWKQEVWSGLNTKLKNLQSKFINNMRWSSAYSKKSTKVSNSSAVSVITGDKAVNGVQDLKINQLAKTAYLTGGQLKGADGEAAEYTALTKMSDILTDDQGNTFSGSGTFSVKTGSKSVDITVDENTSISDVLDKFKSAGLNASFDAKNQRFFVSAKESGLKNDFSITASDANGAKALSALGLQTDVSTDEATKKQYQTYHDYFVVGDREATLSNMSSMINKSKADDLEKYLGEYQTAADAKAEAEKKINDITNKYSKDGKTLLSIDEYKAKIEEIDAKLKELGNEGDDHVARVSLEEQKRVLNEEKADAETVASQQKVVDSNDEKLTKLTDSYLQDVTLGEDGKYTASLKDEYASSIEDNYYNRAAYAYDVLEGNAGIGSSVATKINAQDAVIELNGATFENSSNVFEINGLTFTALSTTAPGESITVTTQNDTDGIYGMIKDFLKEYNSVMNEIDKLYNAESASGYEPLTKDEKEAMSESEISDYEKKIKDALLRRDSNLSTVSSGLKDIMSSGFTVGGKTMYLSDFGINTLGYFEAPDNEKNAYHINGDEDDANTSGKADILKGLISSDPDTVISFFTQMSQKLYSKMTDMSKSVDGYRSFGNFFDDKRMKTDYNDYKTKIAEMEEKLNKYEDSWYKKFSKMETAMAKMQSKTNALSGLFGGN